MLTTYIFDPNYFDKKDFEKKMDIFLNENFKTASTEEGIRFCLLIDAEKHFKKGNFNYRKPFYKITIEEIDEVRYNMEMNIRK